MSTNQALIESITRGYNRLNNPCALLNVPNLITELTSEEWILSTKKTFIDDRGKYRHVYKILWNRLLPNGTYLNSDENKEFREFIQRLFSQYITRTGINESLNIFNLSPAIMLFISWVYLNEIKFQPNTHFLTKISNSDIENFFFTYCNHGQMGLLKVPQRICSKLASELRLVFYEQDNLYLINQKKVTKIIAHFHDIGMYTVNNRGIQAIDLKAFREYFSLSIQETYGIRFKAFIRQFEPDFQRKFPGLLVASRMITEYPSHKTILVSDAISKRISIRYAKSQFNLIFGLLGQYPSFPKQINHPNFYQKEKIFELITRKTVKLEHTRCPSAETVTFYLNKSIRLLLEHGDEILDFYIKSTEYFIDEGWLGTKHSTKRNKYIRANTPEELKKILNNNKTTISGYCVNTSSEGFEDIDSYDRVRNAPTLSDLMYILLGACFIGIAGLLPYRINELSLLKNDCLLKKEGIGFYVRKSFLKSGINGEKITGDRPIHYISAKSIMLLQQFNQFSKEVGKAQRNCDYLLFTLDLNSTTLKTSSKGEAFVKQCIRALADFIEVPLDQMGRRWYVNIHELRKFFIINMFWCFKFGHLDTIRWAAGHTDWQHLENYLEENIGEESFHKIQEVYISLQLFSHIEDGHSDIDGIESLYLDLCKEFSVKQLTITHKQEIERWIGANLLDEYQMEIYTISDLECENSYAVKLVKRND